MENLTCVNEGVVQSVNGTSATVRMMRSHDCGGCKACIFAGKGDIIIPVRNTAQASIGDRVRVDAHKSAGNSLFSMMLALGIPLLLLIISVVVCSICSVQPWLNLIISLVVLALGFGITILAERMWRKSRFASEIIEVLAQNID